MPLSAHEFMIYQYHYRNKNVQLIQVHAYYQNKLNKTVNKKLNCHVSHERTFLVKTRYCVLIVKSFTLYFLKNNSPIFQKTLYAVTSERKLSQKRKPNNQPQQLIPIFHTRNDFVNQYLQYHCYK